MAPVYGFELKTRIVSGIESIRSLPAEGSAFGKKVMIVTGMNAVIDSGALQRVETLLVGSGFQPVFFSQVEPEPSLATVKQGLIAARANQVDWVIGMGGGSAMDVAKVIAGLYREEKDLEYYFDGGAIEQTGLPLITIPTTAGSGAEVTFNAVLSDRSSRVKKSIRDPKLSAAITIVDPQLTFSLPQQVTVNTGLDALVQAIEAFSSKGANPLTDVYAYSAIERIGVSLLRVYQNGQDTDARVQMSLGSLMAGIALSNARLGAVHGLAHPIGILTGKPHGLICGMLLIPVMRFNMAVCHEKYAQIAKALGLNVGSLDSIDAGAQAIKAVMNLIKKLGVSFHLRDLGLTEADLPWIVQESLPSGSLKANPREARPEELLTLLQENL